MFRVVNNSKFKISSTYAKEFIGLAVIDDNFLEKVAAFRSKARLPILSMIYPCSSNKAGFTTLWRSSQPSVNLA